MISFKRIANKDYSNLIVNRGNLYIGKVVAKVETENVSGKKLSKDIIFNPQKNGTNKVDYVKLYRKILFSLDENKLSQDLLYDSPHYYVQNITSDNELNKDIRIIDEVKLESLLSYYGFEEILTGEEIKKTIKMFFNNNSFIYENSEDFGLIRAKRFGIDGYYHKNTGSPFNSLMFENINSIITCREKPHPDEKVKQKVKKLY
ncbi:MAG: hypothetical protein PHO63_00715 [Bacilli bacterium]|nr:hypothetical protein [Bacilli bacterium]MDD4809444.1 hypothetical protein [Bacilli bacterium]